VPAPQPAADPSSLAGPGWAVGAYLDVAEGADDVAFCGRKRFVMHDQEDVVDVVIAPDALMRARMGGWHAHAHGRRRRAYGSAPAALGAAPGHLYWPGGAAAPLGLSSETAAAAAAAAAGRRGQRGPPLLALGPRTAAALAADGACGGQDGLTASSATGSPIAAAVATMQVRETRSRAALQAGFHSPNYDAPTSLFPVAHPHQSHAPLSPSQPHDLSLSPMVLPPGCSIPGATDGSLSPSPLPAWRPRLETQMPYGHGLAPLPLRPYGLVGLDLPAPELPGFVSCGGQRQACTSGGFPGQMGGGGLPGPQGAVRGAVQAGGAGALLAGAFPSSAAQDAPRQRRSRMGHMAGAAPAGSFAPWDPPHQQHHQQQQPVEMMVDGAAQATGFSAAAVAAPAPESSDDEQVGHATERDASAAASLDEAPAAAAPRARAADADDSDDSSGGARARKRPAGRLLTRPAGAGCVSCGATSTPVWRAGPAGPKTLCNRCGVRFSKMSRRNK
jgi:hypothetical protein